MPAAIISCWRRPESGPNPRPLPCKERAAAFSLSDAGKSWGFGLQPTSYRFG